MTATHNPLLFRLLDATLDFPVVDQVLLGTRRITTDNPISATVFQGEIHARLAPFSRMNFSNCAALRPSGIRPRSKNHHPLRGGQNRCSILLNDFLGPWSL